MAGGILMISQSWLNPGIDWNFTKVKRNLTCIVKSFYFLPDSLTTEDFAKEIILLIIYWPIF